MSTPQLVTLKGGMLLFRVHDYNEYEVPLMEFRDEKKAHSWLEHMREKQWFTLAHERELAELLNRQRTEQDRFLWVTGTHRVPYECLGGAGL